MEGTSSAAAAAATGSAAASAAGGDISARREKGDCVSERERESSIGVLVVEIAVWLSLAVFYMTRFYQNTNIIPQVTRVYEVFWALAVFSAQFELVGSRL